MPSNQIPSYGSENGRHYGDYQRARPRIFPLFLTGKTHPLTVSRFIPGTTQTYVAFLSHTKLSVSWGWLTPEGRSALGATVAATYDEEN
jgi:hypothetical protein